MRKPLCLAVAFGVMLGGVVFGQEVQSTRPAPGLDLLGAVRGGVGQRANDVATLVAQKRQLLIVELAGKRARLRALSLQIETVGVEVEKALAADESLASLIKALPLLQQQLEMAQGRASHLEIAMRSVDISTQVTRIAERREFIRIREHHGLLEHLVRMRAEAELDIIDLEAQLAAAEVQLGQLREGGGG